VNKSTFVLAVISACAGCTRDSGPGAQTLGATIRDAGLRCTEVSSAEAIADRENTWRVTCTDSLVYAATLAENGELCIDTIIAGGFSGDLILPPDPRCAPLSGTR
jgi:hypothetical protein